MPDPIAMSEEEQKYFDTRGEEAPVVEKTTEIVKEEPKTAPREVITKKELKQTKKSKEVSAEPEPEPETEAEPVTRTSEQIETDNLKAALKEERRLRAENERRTDERLRLLQQAAEQKTQPPAPQAEPIPDAEKDPLGVLKYLLNKTIQGEQTQQVTQQQVDANNQQRQLMVRSAQLEREYLSKQPDFDAVSGQSAAYNEASMHLMNSRRSELMAMGYDDFGDPAKGILPINQIIGQEAIGLAQRAIQLGRNPAELVMENSKLRGYTQKTKAPVETEQEKITRISKGQEVGFSLGQATGSKAPVNKGLDAKSLATMTDEDFTAFMAKAKKSDMRSLFGD